MMITTTKPSSPALSVVPVTAEAAALTTAGTPKNVDYVAEYDFFTNLRKAHLDRTTREKREEDLLRRKQKREEALRWREGGKEVLHNVTRKVTELRFLLEPHKLLRQSMTILDQVQNKVASHPKYHYATSPHHASALLSCIHEEKRHKSSWTNRTSLIMNKIELMRQIQQHHRLKHPFTTTYEQSKRDWDITRKLFRMFYSYVPISKAIREVLRKKREHYKFVKNKLDMIYKTRKACEDISLCKSIQHYNPKGCSNCGVIFIGGSLEGAIPYVKSVSRDTGVATLVTLEFEFETLAKEEEIQVVIVDEAAKDLAEYEENSVYIHVRTAIQFWWSVVLAYRRMKMRHQQIAKSKYYYKIRRLSVLKNEVDKLIIEREPIDIEYMKAKYVDIIPQMLEYVSKMDHLKSERILKYMQIFHRKLVQLVLEARERRRIEEIRLANLPKPDPPIKIKSMRPVSPKKLVCYRKECQMRKFLTLDRYETHMAVHAKDDEIRYQKYTLARRQKKVKLQEEKFMMDNINKSKQYLAEHLTQNDEESLDEFGEQSDLLLCFPATQESSNSNQASDIGPESREVKFSDVKYDPLSWTNMPHRYVIYGLLNAPRLSLELVSKHSSIDAENKVILDQAVTRIGTHSTCELPIKLHGETERLGKISKIHCLIYHGMATVGHEHEDEQTHQDRKAAFNSLTIVDNSSTYCTYVVGKDGASKVPSKVSKGMVLSNGSLICIGVCKDGPPVLPVTEASLACLVYRLQYA